MAHNGRVSAKREPSKARTRTVVASALPVPPAVKTGLTVDVFSMAVKEELDRIQSDMPFWMWSLDMLAMTRAAVGKCHHPSLWCLAGFMIEFAQQSEGSR